MAELDLDFKCDYANAILDHIWREFNHLAESDRYHYHYIVQIGLLERKTLENWLRERGECSSVLNLPGLGRPCSKPHVFGLPLILMSADEHLKVIKGNRKR